MVHRTLRPEELSRKVTTPDVTLQINLAPSDWRHAQVILPHQIRVWRAQVSEILLVVDLHRSAGRFAANWEEGRDKVLALAHSIEGARVESVNYGEEAQRRVSAEFFGGRPIPTKDFRGGPYYAYFFGLNAARHNLVFHTDSDILFGGGSQTWMAEAVASLTSEPRILVTAPLPGPPRDDGKLTQLATSPEKGSRHAHLMESMSTRIFMMDREHFRSTIGALVPIPPPSLRSRIKALVEKNPVADLPEHLFTRQMREKGLLRRDFIGTDPGMWTLHPPYRCADFFAKLPLLVSSAESGNVPDAQRGDHDINDSMVDWSEARTALSRNRWWRRLARR
jgi:hypothetical protein